MQHEWESMRGTWRDERYRLSSHTEEGLFVLSEWCAPHGKQFHRTGAVVWPLAHTLTVAAAAERYLTPRVSWMTPEQHREELSGEIDAAAFADLPRGLLRFAWRFAELHLIAPIGSDADLWARRYTAQPGVSAPLAAWERVWATLRMEAIADAPQGPSLTELLHTPRA